MRMRRTDCTASLTSYFLFDDKYKTFEKRKHLNHPWRRKFKSLYFNPIIYHEISWSDGDSVVGSNILFLVQVYLGFSRCFHFSGFVFLFLYDKQFFNTFAKHILELHGLSNTSHSTALRRK